MKRILSLLFLLGTSYFLFAQTNEFELRVTFKPFKHQFIYLGYHYGKQKPIIDSVLVDENSVGVFKRAKKLEKGIYLIGFPKKAGYFEVLIDKEQKFSVSADSANLYPSIKFVGSPDNTLFFQYQNYISVRGREIEDAKKQLAASKTKADSTKWTDIIIRADKEIQQYREDLITKNPDATISALLKAMKHPEVPPATQHPGGKYDSVFASRYFKDHYWDDTWFFDERLARTPFFEEKLDQYFATMIYPHPDSVIKELDWMLAYATANDEMQRFLLVKFINRYLNPQYMWEDKVYAHLFEKYFSQKEYSWLNEKGKKTIFDRYYSIAGNLFGATAADIELPDSSGKIKNLYSVTNPYTVVVFWDPTCGHCKETLPRIDSIYRAKWKATNVKIYAVSKETDGTKKDWLSFIGEHQLTGWDHVYYSKEANDLRVKNNIASYYQLYDVQVVPTLYLLDKDKSILAKKIPFDQIDKVLDFKLKGQ
ncbi:MAG TPA: thioredoxin-like domain-containing protein [Chitinophagaceae bacterium]